MGDLIDAGYDVINPVQTTAYQMNSAILKWEFGKDITFWGGGCNTRSVLNRATPEEAPAAFSDVKIAWYAPAVHAQPQAGYEHLPAWTSSAILRISASIVAFSAVMVCRLYLCASASVCPPMQAAVTEE